MCGADIRYAATRPVRPALRYGPICLRTAMPGTDLGYGDTHTLGDARYLPRVWRYAGKRRHGALNVEEGERP
eukprot:2502587-Rhodomonas_salina.5